MNFQKIWIKRKEEDIHDCLKKAYVKLGYEVNNIHASDRSHENGIDLECINAEEIIHIQAKLKPVSSDIKQLKNFARSKADKKIYVYVLDPSRKFDEEIKNYKEKINFWNAEQLHEFFLKTEIPSYIRLLFLSSDLIQTIIETLKEINKSKKVKKTELKTEQLRDWWILKDRAVKLHANLEFLRDAYQTELLKKDRIEISEVKKYIDDLMKKFELINQSSAIDLLYIFKKINSVYPSLISKFINVTERRSNWTGFPFHLDADKKYLEELLIENWLLAKLDEVSFFGFINYCLKDLKEAAKAIEDGVDWVHEDRFKISELEHL
ncbi:MAG: hypothetical protein NTU57_05050 [Candidatus Aenigmarchaeota archaeon]|nr:hypothetical protein [Candidatus Aenigmarchaeota archaeon]